MSQGGVATLCALLHSTNVFIVEKAALSLLPLLDVSWQPDGSHSGKRASYMYLQSKIKDFHNIQQ